VARRMVRLAGRTRSARKREHIWACKLRGPVLLPWRHTTLRTAPRPAVEGQSAQGGVRLRVGRAWWAALAAVGRAFGDHVARVGGSGGLDRDRVSQAALAQTFTESGGIPVAGVGDYRQVRQSPVLTDLIIVDAGQLITDEVPPDDPPDEACPPGPDPP
jgi:hypothetical protein